ncbi:hypothetical protein A2U01_0001613 [Trifolium medium]|uniref:Uncharacterized protein n=1 Tax=Trifolium medium TaxID=97028 RepID=A0A392M1H4_9FABA|nr:hypothetical protein [Trifolium medium]
MGTPNWMWNLIWSSELSETKAVSAHELQIILDQVWRDAFRTQHDGCVEKSLVEQCPIES